MPEEICRLGVQAAEEIAPEVALEAEALTAAALDGKRGLAYDTAHVRDYVVEGCQFLVSARCGLQKADRRACCLRACRHATGWTGPRIDPKSLTGLIHALSADTPMDPAPPFASLTGGRSQLGSCRCASSSRRASARR